MNIREQMAMAICRQPGSLCAGFCHAERCTKAIEFHGADADAVLSVLTNPDDETVERLAACIVDEAIGCCCISENEAAYLIRAILEALKENPDDPAHNHD